MATSKNYGKKKVRITSGIFWTLMGKNLIMEKSDAGAACLSWTFFFSIILSVTILQYMYIYIYTYLHIYQSFLYISHIYPIFGLVSHHAFQPRLAHHRSFLARPTARIYRTYARQLLRPVNFCQLKVDQYLYIYIYIYHF